MPYTPPTVNYGPRFGVPNWQTLTGVQSVTMSRGRQRFNDAISQSSCVIELIPATSYSLPLAIGQNIDVRDANTNAATCYFSGAITDIQRRYDMPYNSSSGYAPGDRIIISATGAIGLIGLGSTDDVSYGSAPITSVVPSLASLQNVAYCVPASTDFYINVPTVSGPILDIVNKSLNAAQYTIDDVVAPRDNNGQYIGIYPTGTAFNTIAFGDNGTGYSYTNLEFLSSVQNQFSWVQVVSPVGGTSTVQSVQSPRSALTYDAYTKDAADTSNLANYVYNLMSGQVSPAPFSIGTNTMASSSCMALASLMKYVGPAVTDVTTSNAVMGQQVSVTFRGSTTYGSVIGVNASFYPDRGNVQLYLSPSLGTPFTLDSTAFGVLDTNRLGYP